MIISEIAHFDFPERWPNLLQGLMNILNNSKPTDSQTFGAIKCLSLVVEHFSDSQLTIVFPTLVPYMCGIVLKESIYPSNIRSKALQVIWELLKLLGMMSSEDTETCHKLLKPLLSDLLKLLLNIIYKPTSNPKDCGVKMYSMRVVVQLLQYFSGLLEPFVKPIIQSVFTSFQIEYSLYHKLYIEGKIFYHFY